MWISVRERRTKKYGYEQQGRKYEEWKVCTKASSSFGQEVGWLSERNRGGQVVRIINLYNDNDSDNNYNKDFYHDNDYDCEKYEILVYSSSDVFDRWSLVVTQQHYKKVWDISFMNTLIKEGFTKVWNTGVLKTYQPHKQVLKISAKKVIFSNISTTRIGFHNTSTKQTA